MALFQLFQLKLQVLFRFDIFLSSHLQYLHWVLRELSYPFLVSLLLCQIEASCLDQCSYFLIFFLALTSFLSVFLQLISYLNVQNCHPHALLLQYRISRASSCCFFLFACCTSPLLRLTNQLRPLHFCAYADDACFDVCAWKVRLSLMSWTTFLWVFLIYCLLHCHHLLLRLFLLWLEPLPHSFLLPFLISLPFQLSQSFQLFLSLWPTLLTSCSKPIFSVLLSE